MCLKGGILREKGRNQVLPENILELFVSQEVHRKTKIIKIRHLREQSITEK